MEEEIHVFTCSKHYHTWIMANCAKCKKEKNFSFVCPLTMAALKSLYFGGYVTCWVAERMGFFDMDDQLKSKPSPVWKCREFEPI